MKKLLTILLALLVILGQVPPPALATEPGAEEIIMEDGSGASILADDAVLTDAEESPSGSIDATFPDGGTSDGGTTITLSDGTFTLDGQQVDAPETAQADWKDTDNDGKIDQVTVTDQNGGVSTYTAVQSENVTLTDAATGVQTEYEVYQADTNGDGVFDINCFVSVADAVDPSRQLSEIIGRWRMETTDWYGEYHVVIDEMSPFYENADPDPLSPDLLAYVFPNIDTDQLHQILTDFADLDAQVEAAYSELAALDRPLTDEEVEGFRDLVEGNLTAAQPLNDQLEAWYPDVLGGVDSYIADIDTQIAYLEALNIDTYDEVMRLRDLREHLELVDSWIYACLNN